MVEYFPVPAYEEHEEKPLFDGAAIPFNGEITLSDDPGLGVSFVLPGFTPIR
jgi:hypothetical protein